MLKSFLIFLSILVLCYCQTHGHQNLNYVHKKKHHHHHGYHDLLFYKGILSYITFWIIKIKVIFVLGTIFTIFMFAGKIFALIKFTEYMKHKPDDHHDQAPIYVQAPDHGHGHDFIHSDSGYPGGSYGGDSYQPYSSGVTLDHPPTGADISYGRKFEENNFYENFDMFARMIRQLNITEMAFDSMKIKTDECKRKFVCEADYNAKNSNILKVGFDLLSDDSYEKYRSNRTISSLNDCEKWYDNCNTPVT